MSRLVIVRVFAIFAAFIELAHAQGGTIPASSRTKVVMLGTGNPSADPNKMGASVAIIVNATPYIVDAGVGLVRRASQAQTAGVKGLELSKLQRVFLTHLHTD